MAEKSHTCLQKELSGFLFEGHLALTQTFIASSVKHDINDGHSGTTHASLTSAFLIFLFEDFEARALLSGWLLHPFMCFTGSPASARQPPLSFMKLYQGSYPAEVRK